MPRARHSFRRPDYMLDSLNASFSSRWADVTPLLYNVRKFGAVGDGSTNDATAIQSAINAANNQGGGIVYFPQKTYKVTSQLSLYSNVHLLGDGYSSVITRTDDGTIFYANGGNNITVSNLRLYGARSNTADDTYTSHRGIFFDGSDNITVENLFVHGWGKTGIAINGDAVSDNLHWTIQNNKIWDCLNGIFVFRGMDYITISNNHISQCNHGIAIDDGTTVGNEYEPRYAIISGNHCEDCTTAGIILEGAQYTNVIGNTCIENGTNQYFQQTVAGVGIDIGKAQSHNNPQHNIVQGNIVMQNWGNGIGLSGALYTLICDNQIVDNGNGGTSKRNIAIARYTTSDGANYNRVYNNVIMKESNYSGLTVGLSINDSDCTENFIYDNYFEDAYAGAWTVISNAGTHTHIWGNENYDDQGRALDTADATPTVQDRRVYYTLNNGSAQDVTTFDDGQQGQILHIIFLSGNTTLKDGATLVLASSSDWTPGTSDTITLIKRSTAWYELCRSDN